MGAYHEEEPGFFQKYRVIIGCGLVVAIALAVGFGQRLFNRPARPRQDQNMVMITLPQALPPPPPPQAPPPPKENEQRIDQETVNPMETKTDTTPDETPAVPAIGTSIVGNGPPDGFGVGGGKSYFGGATGGDTKTHVKASRWGWYANQVQGSISKALQNNNQTRIADFHVVAQIWSDQTGRITRAHLAESTGDAALDKAITNDVLVGLVLQEPPPDGMPMPIVLRLTARRSTASLSRQ